METETPCIYSSRQGITDGSIGQLPVVGNGNCLSGANEMPAPGRRPCRLALAPATSFFINATILAARGHGYLPRPLQRYLPLQPAIPVCLTLACASSSMHGLVRPTLQTLSINHHVYCRLLVCGYEVLHHILYMYGVCNRKPTHIQAL